MGGLAISSPPLGSPCHACNVECYTAVAIVWFAGALNSLPSAVVSSQQLYSMMTCWAVSHLAPPACACVRLRCELFGALEPASTNKPCLSNMTSCRMVHPPPWFITLEHFQQCQQHQRGGKHHEVAADPAPRILASTILQIFVKEIQRASPSGAAQHKQSSVGVAGSLGATLPPSPTPRRARCYQGKGMAAAGAPTAACPLATDVPPH